MRMRKNEIVEVTTKPYSRNIKNCLRLSFVIDYCLLNCWKIDFIFWFLFISAILHLSLARRPLVCWQNETKQDSSQVATTVSYLWFVLQVFCYWLLLQLLTCFASRCTVKLSPIRALMSTSLERNHSQSWRCYVGCLVLFPWHLPPNSRLKTHLLMGGPLEKDPELVMEEVGSNARSSAE